MRRLSHALVVLAIANVLSSCATSPWDRAMKEGSLSAYETFLHSHPDSEHAQEAIRRIDEMHWKQARDTNSVESYRSYIDRHPEGAHYRQAFEAYDEALWSEAASLNKEEGYVRYLEATGRAALSAMPRGRHTEEATRGLETSMWDHAEKVAHSITLYKKYLSRFPEGQYSATATDCIAWAQTEADGTESAIEEYLRTHEDGRFTSLARSHLASLNPKPAPAAVAGAIEGMSEAWVSEYLKSWSNSHILATCKMLGQNRVFILLDEKAKFLQHMWAKLMGGGVGVQMFQGLTFVNESASDAEPRVITFRNGLMVIEGRQRAESLHWAITSWLQVECDVDGVAYVSKSKNYKSYWAEVAKEPIRVFTETQ